MAEQGDPHTIPIMSVKEAKAAGLTRFYTGRPCHAGHIAQRMTNNRSCVLCRDPRSRPFIALGECKPKPKHPIALPPKQEGDKTAVGGWIYKITHLPTGRAYIGLTQVSVEWRWRWHVDEAHRAVRIEQKQANRQSVSPLRRRRWYISRLQRLIVREGISAFQVETLAECATAAELRAAEQRLIVEHGTRHPVGFNMNDGGALGEAIPITLEGKTYATVAAACLAYGRIPQRVYSRLRIGWTPEMAFDLAPAQVRPNDPKPVEYRGVYYPSLSKLAEAFGVPEGTFLVRLRRGFTVAEGLGHTKRKKRGPNTKQVEVNGQVYRSYEAAADALGLKRSTFAARLRKGKRGEDLAKPVQVLRPG